MLRLSDVMTDLRLLLADAGLRQTEVAKQMHLDPSIIGLWVSGKRPIPTARIPALLEALDVEVDPDDFTAELLSADAPEEQRTQADEPLGAVLDLSALAQAEADEEREQRLAVAGMLPSGDAKTYELHCLLCGRGTGAGGVLVRLREVPRCEQHCAFCGGFMLAEETPVRSTVLYGRLMTHPMREVA